MDVFSVTNCPLDPKLGSGKTVMRWSDGLRSLGHNVRVFQPLDYEAAAGLRCARQLRLAVGAWQLLCKEMVHHKPDLIEFYGAEFWLAISQLAKRRSRPLLVAHTNGLEPLHHYRAAKYIPRPYSLKSKLRAAVYERPYEQLENMAFTRSDVFVALCELDCDYVVKNGYYAAKDTCVIPPGLDVEYLNRPSPQVDHRPDRIAFTGTWTARKSPATIVEVMTRVLRLKPTYTFEVFGSGDESGICSAFPEDLRGRVIVHGRLSNEAIASELSQCKVFFFPSEYEGFGMALAEAMSCGCAAVATPTGFGAELKDGMEALLCDFSEVSQMEKAILNLLDDDALRGKLSINGWKRTRDMHWSSSVQRLSDVYGIWLKQHAVAAKQRY
jgi:glycosyltransferase involved in cell wall biosynthesis